MPNAIIRHDEPAATDQLKRAQYASAFAELASTCDAPMVIGLYGGWGVGKTTLMRLIEATLPVGCASVWFDSWLHQYDDSPALALLQAVVQQLGMGEEGKKLLMAVSLAFTGALMQKLTGIAIKDVRETLQQFEEERFQIREARARLKEYFGAIVDRATDEGRTRLVFFIDDLDRCSPETTLAMLEALKLYLNLPRCVYFLGVDRSALERSIAHKYGAGAISEINYLDKIVQLPFAIPPIPPDSMGDYVASLLSQPLASCKDVLIRGLGDNPRRVKRFVNALALNHQLAETAQIADYDPVILAAILVVQYRNTKLYERFVESPELLKELMLGSIPADQRREMLGDDTRLEQVLAMIKSSVDVPLQHYLYLTRVVGVIATADEYDIVLADAGDKKINVIRLVRELKAPNMGLKEAKDMVEAPPQVVLRANRERATAIQQQFQDIGAKVVLRPVAGAAG